MTHFPYGIKIFERLHCRDRRPRLSAYDDFKSFVTALQHTYKHQFDITRNRSNFDLSVRWKMKCFASETWNDAMHHEMCYAHEMKFALLHMRFCAFHVPAEHFMAQPFHLPTANELPKANFIAHLRCAKLQFNKKRLSQNWLNPIYEIKPVWS